MGESKDWENKSSNDHQDRLKTKISSRTKSTNFIKIGAIFVMKTRGWCLNEVGPDDGGEPAGDGEDTCDRQENKDGDVDGTVAW